MLTGRYGRQLPEGLLVYLCVEAIAVRIHRDDGREIFHG